MLQKFLRIGNQECTFGRRGFLSSGNEAQARLETVGSAFLLGYNTALRTRDAYELPGLLDEGDAELQGFRYEGASMALKLCDLLLPMRNRWQQFASGPANRHIYMVYVGAGWAYAAIPWLSANRALRDSDPVLSWLAIDGYGFYEGYFGGVQRVLTGWPRPSRVPYVTCALDQGMGRSLWFSCGADSRRIAIAITETAATRHADLWSGIGLAAAYAGPVDTVRLNELTTFAGEYAGHLAQGAAFAAQARRRAANPATHTERACEWFCGMPAEAAARVTEAEYPTTQLDSLNAYEAWRASIRRHFTQMRALA